MKQMPNLFTNKTPVLLVPSLDHKEPEDDDCGLPENPIFSNYSKYLWQGHSENRRIRKNTGLPENTDGHNHVK